MAVRAALEQTGTYGNIKPLVDLIGGLNVSQAAESVERSTQRPESGDWTSPPPGSDI